MHDDDPVYDRYGRYEWSEDGPVTVRQTVTYAPVFAIGYATAHHWGYGIVAGVAVMLAAWFVIDRAWALVAGDWGKLDYGGDGQ